MNFGCQSMVGKIERLLLKHPRDAFISEENVRSQWKELNYSSEPNYEMAIREYKRFVELLENHIPEINYLPQSDQVGLDSIYVHDPVIVTRRGAILCRMGKELRRHEPSAVGDFLPNLGIPIFGTITGEGRLEGGDVVWINERTLAVGTGERTNGEGIRQLKHLTADLIDELVEVPLPDSAMHLMSLMSFIDYDLAMINAKLLPGHFRKSLLSRGIKLLEVLDSEYERQSCNILAIAPRKCLILSGNPQTKQILLDESVGVWEYDGEEISLKGTGGPTCLTRPLFRT